MKKIPKLRFREFEKEWEEKNLKNIATFSKGKLISKEDISETGIECIRYGELYTTYNEVISNVVSKTNLNISNLVLSEKNDIIIPCSGETAMDIAKASCVIKSGVALGGDLNILKLKENGIFLSYYLNNKAKYQIASLAQGASVVHLYEDHLKKLKVKIPNLKEQKKIADFLSSVDVKINLTENKLELLKEYKKEIMQKIFNRELRFKDENGNDYPNWEEKKLGDIVQSISNGISINQNFDKIGYKVTRIETISEAKINLKRIGYITTDKNIKEYKLNIGDLLFSNINSVEHIGKLAYVDKDYNLYHGMNLLRIVFKENLNSKYFYYLLTERKYKKLFEKLCNKAVSQASINQTELSKIKVYNPCLEEQQKIADFFSSIDNKIEKISDELENLKEFKKGLLQQMFI